MRKALIIANGIPPPQNLLRKVVANAHLVLCADGGANIARSMGIMPDIILGDLDSITAATRKKYAKIQTLLVEDQHSTDLEKAIRYCLRHSIDSIDVVAATGGRVDHMIGNLWCFKRFGKKIEMKFIDGKGEISLIKGKTRFKTRKGEKLSLIPLDRCHGITTSNLKYKLKDEVLELGRREGISNEATGSSASIEVKHGTLLLYRFTHR